MILTIQEVKVSFADDKTRVNNYICDSEINAEDLLVWYRELHDKTIGDALCDSVKLVYLILS